MPSYVFVAVLIGALGGWWAGILFPPCCPGAARGCNIPNGALGVQYCRLNGFGWEQCQALVSPYPQALWRSER